MHTVRLMHMLLILSVPVALVSACAAPPGPAQQAGARATTAGTATVATPGNDSPAMERTMELIAAAERGDIAVVKQLLVKGTSVDARDGQGRTALIAAAYPNHLDVAEVLIKAGADVNAQDHTRQSAYLIATSEGYIDLLRLTLQAGADVRSTDSFNGTGLIRAADRGHVEILEELLKTDIDVNHVNRLGWTALLEAIILGDGSPRHTDVVRLLIESRADVNLADGTGVTPLAHARQHGYSEIVKLLESAGAR